MDGAKLLLLLVPLLGGWAYLSWRRRLSLKTLEGIAEAFLRLLEAKDPHTACHSRRVGAIAERIALEMGLSPKEVYLARIGGILHDIGKVGVPERLLRTKRLSREGWRRIHGHPIQGARLLLPLGPLFEEVIPIVLYHHERWDGGGYPEGRRGEEIPLLARIVAVADAYEAMTGGRPYRPPLSPLEALREIQRLSGSQFDPGVVEAFLRAWKGGSPWVE